MKVEFLKSFSKDLDSINSKSVKQSLIRVIAILEKADKFTYIHEREMPKELRRLVQFILDLKNNLNFYHADTVIYFKSNHIKVP